MKAERAFGLILIAGYLMVLAIGLPGHLQTDSIVQLLEGRSGIYASFNPRIMSWLLGRFDAVLAGTALFVTVSAGLIYGSLLSLGRLRGRVSWWAVPVAAALAASPLLLIYQGSVLKDVAFANLAVAGFVALAFAAKWRDEPSRAVVPLTAAFVALAIAALTRQNGALAVLMAAIAFVVVTHGRGRLVVRSGWAALAFVAVLGSGVLATKAIERANNVPDDATRVGLRVLEHYDIAGIVAAEPDAALPEIERADPKLAALVRRQAPIEYSPERVDKLLTINLWGLDDEAVQRTWAGLVMSEPEAYLRHRLSVFGWAFMPPNLGVCLPLHVGVDGPPERLQALGMQRRMDVRDTRAYAYAQRFFPTPVYSHLAYLLVALAVAGLLLTRRDPADLVMVALLAAGVGFAASFLAIAISCDYRYLYFLDLSAMTGLIYLAVDPPTAQVGRLWRKWRPGS